MKIYAGAGYGSVQHYKEDVFGFWANVTDISMRGVALDCGFLFALPPDRSAASSRCGLAAGLGVTAVSFRQLSLNLELGLYF